jgi:pimeloyl-ACP methyl ester carboxylesterase
VGPKEIPHIDLFGFSMGNFAAQMVTLHNPAIVRRLVLAGSSPSAGEGVEGGGSAAFGRLATARAEREGHDSFLESFYSQTPKGQDLAEKWWRRMITSRSNRSDYVGPEGTNNQIAALMWDMGS